MKLVEGRNQLHPSNFSVVKAASRWHFHLHCHHPQLQRVQKKSWVIDEKVLGSSHKHFYGCSQLYSPLSSQVPFYKVVWVGAYYIYAIVAKDEPLTPLSTTVVDTLKSIDEAQRKDEADVDFEKDEVMVRNKLRWCLKQRLMEKIVVAFSILG